ncbi:hypothetical protein [Croceiramulus getboli]|nr:hypothetical protein P8624_09590 [Flavobacteriaceae bacterium YJPT1-3]
MKYFVQILTLILVYLSVSCSSSELVENWKNPEIEEFYAQKVLVIAISSDQDNRKIFERQLAKRLEEEGVFAVTSQDVFKSDFTSMLRSEAELDALRTDLVEEGIDAVLLSKLLGAEDKVTLVQAYGNLRDSFRGFEEDYMHNQEIYNQENEIQKYTVYHASSALYCICPDKEKELIWQGSIDITEPDSPRKAIKDYINLLTWALEEQQLLFVKPML